MAAVPAPSRQTVAMIYAWYEAVRAGGHRPHLGASLIGHHCERYLWLTFRWAAREQFDGRMLRLFEAGKAFEPRIVAELRAIGVEVHEADENGVQFRVSAVGGHFGGSMDGAAHGLPEAPKTWAVLEFKTHSAKSFMELVAKGVRLAKPTHWDQMQTYMGLSGMERAMYLAENKDTSELYQERVEFDKADFDRIMARADRIVRAAEPPARISNDPAWYQCKWCAMSSICHGTEAPEVNCRTCAHSTPELDGNARWSCAHHKVDLPEDDQRAGCGSHRYIPILLERIGTQRDAVPEPDGNAAVWYELPDGKAFANGAPPHFSSNEIRAAKHKEMLGDERVQELKATVETARLVA